MRILQWAIAALFLVLPAQALASGHVMTNGRITIDFADPAYGDSSDSNRIDSLVWIDSDGAATGNLVANSTSLMICGEPKEYFGQSYSDKADSGKGPFFVIAGSQSSWLGTAVSSKILTSNKADACLAPPQGYKVNRLSGGTKTQYYLSTASTNINRLHVWRTFWFRPGTEANNFKVYTPRLNDAIYDTVIIPDANSVPKTYSARNCGGVCEITDWNGRWFADDDGNGNGLMVVRDPTATAPAVVSIDQDAGSNSNLTAIALVVPPGGWQGKLVDSEYLCFYDAKSWSAANRAAGILPTGCQVR